MLPRRVSPPTVPCVRGNTPSLACMFPPTRHSPWCFAHFVLNHSQYSVYVGSFISCVNGDGFARPFFFPDCGSADTPSAPVNGTSFFIFWDNFDSRSWRLPFLAYLLSNHPPLYPKWSGRIVCLAVPSPPLFPGQIIDADTPSSLTLSLASTFLCPLSSSLSPF